MERIAEGYLENETIVVTPVDRFIINRGEERNFDSSDDCADNEEESLSGTEELSDSDWKLLYNVNTVESFL